MEKGGWLAESEDDQNSNPQAPTRRKRGGCKNVMRGAMKESKSVRVIEGNEDQRNDPLKYFLPTGVRSTF